eukprot:jgi/Hompol1/738/HPOL_005424-RA
MNLIMGTFIINSSGLDALFSPNRSLFIMPGNRSIDDPPIDFDSPPEDFVDWSDVGVKLIIVATILTMVIGMTVVLMNNFTLIGKVKDVGCAMRSWIVPTGLSIVFGCFIVKASDTPLAKFITAQNRPGILFVLLFVAVSIALSAIVSTKYPTESILFYSETESTYMYICDTCITGSAVLTLVLATYIAALGIASIALAIINRDLPDIVNDSRQVAISALLILLLGAFALFQGFVLELNGLITRWRRGTLMLMNDPLFCIRYDIQGSPQSIWDTQHLPLKDVKMIKGFDVTNEGLRLVCKMAFKNITILVQFRSEARNDEAYISEV